MSFVNNDSYLFVKEFADRIKHADKAESIQRLMNEIPQLLATYPDQTPVMEAICKAVVQASLIGSVCSIVLSNDCRETVTLFITTLCDLDLKTQSAGFIRLACEAVPRILVLFSSNTTHFQLVASFFQKISDIPSPEALVAFGGSFPSDLPSSFYGDLVEFGTHGHVRNLVSLYTEMEELDFANVLKVLSSFLLAKPSCCATYITDSTHFLLLFAAQHFPNSYNVQEALWGLLSMLVASSREFVLDLNPPVLIPAVSSYIMSSDEGSLYPVANFLSEYGTISNSDPPFVVYCFEEHPDLLLALLNKLDPSRVLSSKRDKDEVTAVAELLELFFIKHKQRSTYKHIAKHQLLESLQKAAVQWPEQCCLSYCNAIKYMTEHFPPDNLKSHPALMQLMKQPMEDRKDFNKVNRFTSFVDILNNPVTFNSQEIRVNIYEALKHLLIFAPSEDKGDRVTDEFLKEMVTCLPKDVRTFPQKMQNFVFLGHFLMYVVKKERMKVIQEQKWHEVAVDCLKLAGDNEARNSTLGFLSCILQGYSQLFKDVSSFTNTDFPQLLIDIAKRYGKGANSHAGENFGSLLLTLTADKQAPVALHKNGYLDQLYPLVDDIYDPMVVRPAIHAVGNIALSGHQIKQEILEKDFHLVLIDYLDTKMTTADPYVLSACCRVLHILASGDWAKCQFAKRGLVGILLKMLETRRDNAEVCWRPLGLLSSLGFMSLSNREYIITEKVLRSVLNLLKTTEHSKVKSYTALVFLASIDSDRRSADLQSMKVTEIFQQVLQETEKKDSSYEDLQRWGMSLLEKGHLFTIPLNTSSTSLGTEQKQLLANCMTQSITWPERPSSMGTPPKESVDGGGVQLLAVNDSNLAPKFPTAPDLTEESISQMAQLGIDHSQVFRVGRLFGSSHGHCSNCDKEGRSEELVFRPESLTPHQYQELITRGWYRRGGVKLYRYRYNHDLECSDWETRVLISEFDHTHHKSYKKVLRRMPEDRLTIETVPTQFIPEAYDLYNSYHLTKHDKPLKSQFSYCEHIVNSPFRNQSIDGFQYGTFHQLYRLDGKLVGVGVIDIVPNGIVSVYMWYNTSKEVSKYSFGVYSALKEIEFAKELSKCNPNIKYYYLQGWNENNHKLNYKARYEPEEFYSPCTVSDWVMSLEGVKKEQENFKEKWLAKNGTASEVEQVDASLSVMQNHTESSSKKDDKLHVPGDALSLDRVAYHAQHGPDEPNIMNIVVCLNHQIYMYLGQMLDTYSIVGRQRELLMDRFRELYYAVGLRLAKNMIVDLMACPTTGSLQNSSIY